jgi:hypothetical protein
VASEFAQHQINAKIEQELSRLPAEITS